MKNCIVAFLLSCLLAFSGLAQAQAPLTDDQISRWIRTVQELQMFEDDFDDEEDWALAEDEDLSLEQIYRQLAQSEARVREIIQRHGFRDGDEWAGIGSRISQAFMTLEAGDMQAEFRREMEQARREIRQSEHFTDEQKAMMLEQIEQSQKMMEAHLGSASEEDVAAVRAKRRELRELFEYDDDD
ncbi:MAG: hypothetical protein JJT90_14590 [Ectothiorhodospiraceae bacterium]|nr:hypothetical protein [Ectothiorhodospiraceae bacterium]